MYEIGNLESGESLLSLAKESVNLGAAPANAGLKSLTYALE